MNIQIFTNVETDKPVSINMDTVIAINEVEACAVLHNMDGYKQDSDIVRALADCAYNDMAKATGFAIDAGLNTEEDTWHVQCRFTVNEVWDALDYSDNTKYTEQQKKDSLFENFTDDDAMHLMVKYWKDIADTPLTKNIIGENHFRVKKELKR